MLIAAIAVGLILTLLTVSYTHLLWTLIFGSSLALIIQGPIEVLLPFLTRERFEEAEATFGFLLAAYGIGGAVGSLVVSSLKLPRRYLTFMILCWGGGTLPLVVIGAVDNLIVMLAALFIVGATTGAGVVIWGTLLQRLVPVSYTHLDVYKRQCLPSSTVIQRASARNS